MKHFASLIDHLASQRDDAAKIRLLADYFEHTRNPDRGCAAGLLAGTWTLPRVSAKDFLPRLRACIDPVLFDLSDELTADKIETLSLVWPNAEASNGAPTLSHLVETVENFDKKSFIHYLEDLFGHLTPSERWALLKLASGRPVAGISAHLVRQSLAVLGSVKTTEVAEVWHSCPPPYLEIFDWLEGRRGRPQPTIDAPFRALCAIEEIGPEGLAALDSAAFHAEWQPPGHRVMLTCESGTCHLYSEDGNDISAAFPELIEPQDFDFTLEGWLVTGLRERWNALSEVERRMKMKRVTKAVLASNPAYLLCSSLRGESKADPDRLSFGEHLLPPLPIDVTSWEAFLTLRSDRSLAPSWARGLILQHNDTPSPTILRMSLAPYSLRAVLLYYEVLADGSTCCTLGVWQEIALVPVAKAICPRDRAYQSSIKTFILENTVDRFGPVREVTHTAECGLLFDVSFASVEPAPRRKAGLILEGCEIVAVLPECPPRQAGHLTLLRKILIS